MVAINVTEILYFCRIGFVFKAEGSRLGTNPLKEYGKRFSFDFNLCMPIMTINRTRQGYARKRILKLAGHFF